MYQAHILERLDYEANRFLRNGAPGSARCSRADSYSPPDEEGETEEC